MPEKKNAVQKVTAPVPDATAAAPKADKEPLIQPPARPLGSTEEPKHGEGQVVEAEASAAAPAGRKSAAVRMMTRSIAGKKPAAARGESQRVADTAKPSQKPAASGGRRGPRRGASKGR